jgi:transcriptional regulator of NAD metabolism
MARSVLRSLTKIKSFTVPIVNKINLKKRRTVEEIIGKINQYGASLMHR